MKIELWTSFLPPLPSPLSPLPSPFSPLLSPLSSPLYPLLSPLYTSEDDSISIQTNKRAIVEQKIFCALEKECCPSL
jgi:hypothetical protein